MTYQLNDVLRLGTTIHKLEESEMRSNKEGDKKKKIHRKDRIYQNTVSNEVCNLSGIELELILQNIAY